MAKLKVKNLKQVQNSIRKDLTKILREKSVRQGVAEIVVNEIRSTKFGTAHKFTVKMREYLKQFNKVHEKFKMNDIRITFTGELLNDLIKNIKASFNKGTVDYVIEHSDKMHKVYRQASNSKKKKIEVTSLKTKKTRDVRDFSSKQKPVSYKTISENIIHKNGYDYLKFSESTKEKVIEFIRKTLFNKLKK